MKNSRLFPSFVVAAALALVLVAVARAEPAVSTIKFSDPAKPGTVKILAARGDIRITGADTPEITVRSEAKAVTKAPRQDGLRVLTPSSSFALTEKDNVVTLDGISGGWSGSSADYTLTVPRGTSVNVQNSWGGDITCSGTTGDVEIKSMNGEIRLDDIAGGVLVETLNGEIRATIRALQENKPLSFTSMNGEVVLRLPAAAKANVRLRTQNGSVLTDFDEAALVTKTEAAPRATSRRTSRTPKSPTATPPTPATPAAPASTPKPGLDDRDKEEIRAAIRENMRAGVEAVREGMVIAHEAIQAAHEGLAEAGVTLRLPAMPPLPAMTGGKLVTGTLNGGGPEISVATMNGDVTLRRVEAKN